MQNTSLACIQGFSFGHTCGDNSLILPKTLYQADFLTLAVSILISVSALEYSLLLFITKSRWCGSCLFFTTKTTLEDISAVQYDLQFSSNLLHNNGIKSMDANNEDINRLLFQFTFYRPRLST